MANHMSEVAELLELELGEAFQIDNCRSVAEMYYRLTEDGLEQSDTPNGEWNEGDEWILALLLTGEADIIQLPWKPQEGEKYYVPRIAIRPYDRHYYYYWDNSGVDIKRYDMGIVCKTPEEAIKLANKMLAVAKESRE
nr:MAG TPA: hypothetical protein [Caudoviricetes sp.]